MRRLVCLLAALTLAAGVVQGQTVLLEEVHTVGTPGAAVPVEFTVDIGAAGNYEVTLTDLGAPGAALSSVRLAVTQDATVIGTPLTAPGALSFAATQDTRYTIHVTGTPGAVLGSGLFRVDVRNPATSMLVNSFVDILAPPPGQPTAGQFLMEMPLTVPTTGSYEVSLRDLLLPQQLPTLLLAVVEQGGSLVAALDIASGNPASQTVTLDATRQYRVFAIAVPDTPTAGGLYSLQLGPTGGASVIQRTVAVGGAVLLGSINLADGDYDLSLGDLAFPASLAAAVVDVVQAGQLVAQALAPGDVSFTAVAGPHEVYGFGVPANGALAGSLNVDIGQGSQPATFTAAHVFASDGIAAFKYEAAIANAAGFRVRLADYEFPAAFDTLRLAAVQDGGVVGTPLPGPGNFDINAQAGKITLLVVADANAAGSLFGVERRPRRSARWPSRPRKAWAVPSWRASCR